MDGQSIKSSFVFNKQTNIDSLLDDFEKTSRTACSTVNITGRG